METGLFHAHSGVRWLVVGITVVAFVWLLIGLFKGRAYDKTTHRIMTAFSSLIGAQWLLGIILFLVMDGSMSLSHRWEHAGTMTLALLVAHLHMPFKRRPDSLRYKVGLGVIIAVLVIVYIGVARLPQGWGM